MKKAAVLLFSIIVVLGVGAFPKLSEAPPSRVSSDPRPAAMPEAREAVAYDEAEDITATSSAPSGVPPVDRAVTETAQQHTPAQTLPTTATTEEQNSKELEDVLPYATAPLDLESLNSRTRAALINILCIGAPPLKSTSGTGIILSNDGLVLTNAHIGQYVLLADSGAQLSCFARIGSPAVSEWPLETVYLPPSWTEKHAASLVSDSPRGTGEDDYALLRIVRATHETHALSALPYDIRTESLSTGPFLLAGYPAEFMSGANIQRFLYAQSSSVEIRELYTFSESVIDAVSVGSNPLAQQGSSGGALMNSWGYLVGLITTTTVGESTAERDLRAITLGHVARSLSARGLSLPALVSREPSALLRAAEQTQEALVYLKNVLP